MRIYTASAFGNYRRVREFNDYARDLGHSITFDWTLTEEFDENGDLKIDRENNWDAHLDGGVALRYAEADMEGVTTADLLVFIADEGEPFGALIEVGAALAYGVMIWAIQPQRRSVFWALPRVMIFDSEEVARQELYKKNAYW